MNEQQHLAELEEQLHQRVRDLAKAEQRIQAVVDHVVDGIITIDDRGTIETLNPAGERIFGYKAAEVIGQNVRVLMPEPYHSQHDCYLRNYLSTGQAKIIGIGREVSGRRKDGSVFPMDLAVNEFHLEDRRYFVGIVRDITERRRSERVARFLAEASTTLAALVDYESTLQTVARLAVPFFADWCAVDMVEPDGSLSRVAVEHADPDKVGMVRALSDLWPTDPRSVLGPARVVRTGRSEMAQSISGEMLAAVARDEEHLGVLRDLRLHSYISAPLVVRERILGVVTFVSAESGHHYGPADLELAEDLARRAAIAIENARLYAELRDADRRKDEFLAMLAHELRNPLAPIRSGLDLMTMPGVDTETVAWTQDMMKQQVEHMVRLVDDLLDVSRIMRGKTSLRKARVDLGSVIARSIDTARPLIESQQIRLEVSLPPEVVWLEADSVRLAQVFANLLNNAAKYNERGGRIWISARREGDQAVVRVRDSGVGIERDLLPRVFDLFTQADRSAERSQGGLGIGLTLVRSLVEMHGGSVKAHSDGPGKGSEFVVTLPAMPPQAEAPAARAETAASPGATAAPAPRRRVLVVDDNVDAARSYAEIARLWKHEVRVAYDGPAALEMAKAYRPEIVLLDIGLPGISGYEVARRLRQQPEFQKTFLVATTGYGQEEDRRRSREAGFNCHLVKPVAPDTLQDLLAHPESSVDRLGSYASRSA